jgi:hypothetical protein
MNSTDYTCPQPGPWNDIHQTLTDFHQRSCRDSQPPPIPLILAGWAYSSDEEKTARWKATIAWAAGHGASHLIPPLAKADRYT